MGKLIIPENYRSCLSSYETQEAIGMIKILMQKKYSGCTYGSTGCTFSCKMEAYGTL